MKNLTILVLAVALLVSCGDAKKKAEVLKLKAEVEALHTAAMGQSDLIKGLKEKLNGKIQGLVSGGDTSMAVAKNIDALKAVVAKLQGSEDGMMKWMNDFKADKEGTAEEVVSYLTEQKGQMEEIKKNCEEAVSAAKSSLGEEAGSLMDKAGDMVEGAKEGVEGAVEGAKEGVEGAKETLKEGADAAKETVEGAVKDVKETVSH